MRASVIALSDALHRVARLMALVALGALVAVVCLQILARYGLSAPPVWTEEAARFALVWFGLTGATMSFKARFDPAPIPPRVPVRMRRLLVAIQTLVVLIFVVPILYFSVMGTNGTFARSFLGRALRSTSETMDIPIIWMASAVPFAFSVILVHLAARWFDNADYSKAADLPHQGESADHAVRKTEGTIPLP